MDEEAEGANPGPEAEEARSALEAAIQNPSRKTAIGACSNARPGFAYQSIGESGRSRSGCYIVDLGWH